MNRRSKPCPCKFSLGRSTHPLDHFLALLAQHGIEALADIRRFPGSRKYGQFNRDNLASALQMAGIEYHWLEALGGRRGKRRDGSATVNLGLQNAGFRNYADYMLTEEFPGGRGEAAGSCPTEADSDHVLRGAVLALPSAAGE